MMENVQSQKQLVISYSGVYGEAPAINIETLLQEVPMYAALQYLSDFFHRTSVVPVRNRLTHMKVLQELMQEVEQEDREKLNVLIRDYDIFHNGAIFLFSADCCLSLLQYILKINNAKRTSLSQKDWSKLLKAILTANELSSKQERELFDWDFSRSALELLDVILPVKMRQAKHAQERAYKVALIKIDYFFKFCQGNATYAVYLVETFDFGKLKSDMGKYFSEHILFYAIMEKCALNWGDLRLNGAALKAILRDSEPDYYIRNGNKIYLFEFKDATIALKTKMSGSAEVIKNDLSDKFVISNARPTKPKSKAVAQLVSSAKMILSGRFGKEGIDSFTTGEVVIYPIFIFTDAALESHGVNYYLNNRLSDLVLQEGVSGDVEKGMVMINLDTLIIYQDYIREGKIDFSALIDAYILYTSEPHSINKVLPFDEYIKYYIAHKGYDVNTKPKDFDDIIELLTGSKTE